MHINERKFEFSKLLFEPFRRVFIFDYPVLIVHNDNTTFVEGEAVFRTLRIVTFRAECCVTLETTYDEDDATH